MNSSTPGGSRSGSINPGSRAEIPGIHRSAAAAGTDRNVLVIRGLIAYETAAIAYCQRRVAATDGADCVTQGLASGVLGDEQGHLRRFEGFLRELEMNGKA